MPQAARFDASTDQLTATTGLPASSTYTVTCWVYTLGTGTRYRNAWTMNNSGFSQGSGVTIRDSPTDLQALDYALYGGGGVNPLAASTSTWYKTALVVSGTNATFYRSAEGNALVSGSVTDYAPVTAPNKLYIGDDEFDSWFDGRIAAFKMWQAALNSTEIDAEFTQYDPVRLTNLLRSHRFDGDITDRSGNSNALTAGGTAVSYEAGPSIPLTAAADPSTVQAAGRWSPWMPLRRFVKPLQLLGSAEAGVIDTGALAGATPALSGALAGDVVDTGALAGTTSMPTGALTGSVIGTGALAGATPALSGALTGDVIDTGALAGTVSMPTGALAGVVINTGALAGSTPTLSGALTGSVIAAVDPNQAGVQAAPMFFVPSVASTQLAGSTAVVPVATGALAGATPAASGALAGSVIGTGALAGATPAASGGLTGSVIDTGALAGSTPPAFGSLTTSTEATGVLAGTTPAASGALTTSVFLPGALAAGVPMPTGALAGVERIDGALAGAIPALAGALAGALTMTGVLAGATPRPVGALTTLPPTVYPLHAGTIIVAGGRRHGGTVVDNVTRYGAGTVT